MADLTRRNWGAPWHGLFVALFGSLYVRLSGASSMEDSVVRIGTLFLLLLMIVYELFQITRRGQTARGAAEDIALNALGYGIAIMPLIG